MKARERIKTTLLKLLEQLPADQLTVKMLCMEAGISKQTLYNNYYGILEVVEEVIGELVDETVKDFHSTDNWFEGILSVLKMIGEKKNVVNHLYNSKFKYDMLKAISERINPIVEEGICESAQSTGVELDADDREIMANMYMDVFMGMITRYLNKKMTEDPIHLVYIYKSIMANRTTDAIYNIGESQKYSSASE